MNIRRIIYIVALCLIAAVVYYSGQESYTPGPEPITREAVLDAFTGPTGIPEDLLRDNYHPADLYFSGDYEGNAGDEFYVTLAAGDKTITLKYLIRSVGSPAQLEYYCKDRWEEYKPPAGKFEHYVMQNNAWIRD